MDISSNPSLIRSFLQTPESIHSHLHIAVPEDMDVYKASALQQIDVFPDRKREIARTAPRIMRQSFCFSLAVPLLITPPPEQLLFFYGLPFRDHILKAYKNAPVP